jgi:hypothetical protein
MPKFKLICDHSCDLDTHVVTHEFNADYLPEVIMNLDMFLKGAGYVYDGELDIATYEQPELFDSQDVLATKSNHYFDTGRNR